MLTPFVKLRAGTQLFSFGHCTFLSVKLTQNGRETIQSVKVRVHHTVYFKDFLCGDEYRNERD